MHVLQVTPYFPPTWAYGGIPRVVWGLGRALVERGVQVSVLTTDAFDAERRSGVPQVETRDGMRIITLPNLSNRLAYHHQLFLPWDLRLGLEPWLADQDPVDVVHLHGHRHLLNNAAVRHARRHDIPYVMTANGTLPRIERKKGLKLAWDALVAGGIPAGASRCIAVSRAEVEQYRDAGITRVVVIPNGLDLGEFDPLPPRGAFRARWGIPAQAPLVAYLGRISPRKGVEHLLEAFIPRPPAGAWLVVAGNLMGMGAHFLDGLPSGSRICFPGLLEARERIELLVDADVLVYPGSQEIFGLVPFEGLLSGTPVVVADDCGCGELIAEAGAGLLVRHGDVEALQHQIETLLTALPLRQSLVRRGQAYIRARLDWRQIAATHQALYQEIVESHHER